VADSGILVFLGVLLCATTAASVAILLVVTRIHRESVEGLKLLKRSDLHMDLNRRFDRIMDMRDRVEQTAADTREVKSFYRRFWELQSTQYLYWNNGWVTDEDMMCWVQWRQGDWEENAPLGKDGYTFRQSWLDCRERYLQPGFADFMEQVFGQGAKFAMEDTRRRAGSRGRG